jgi:hypothetical protein
MPSMTDRGSSLLAEFRFRRHRAALLALLGWVLLAQALLVAHRIDHNGTGHSISCSLCVAADHAAATSTHPIQLIANLRPTPAAALTPESPTSLVVLPYQSRAPPDHVDS